ncbi:hypothetical protein IGB42_03050 [Andreprevotia sp. IGB-42]|uniref:cell envelope integrity protein TolA n=1 Tax=Andreprevotia sp. IGB-42 TaxID=2497473 RepID=UPI00135976A4|nr:TonB C-terminal domain-containing protein [Andreprevotia sp. IGB-42]KAF0812382.1 hypothetical protein IGB42_03050 [Andreprevotia sp. IGB-42]
MSDPRVANREDHQILSLFMAIAIHVLLVVWMVFAVHWKTQKPAAIEVELWGGPPPAAVREPEPVVEQPVVRPPKPAPVVEKPEPAVKDPDIATGKARPTPVATPRPTVTPRPSITPKPTLAPKPTLKPTVAPTPQATLTVKPTAKSAKPVAPKEDAFSAALSEGAKAPANAKPEGKPGGNGNNAAARVNAPGTGVGGGGAGSDKLRGYGNSVAQLIKSRIVYPGSDNPKVEFKITLFPDGTVRELKLVGGDGNAQWQEAVTRAIQSVGGFPPPPAGITYDQVKTLNFSFRPKD